MAHKPPTRYSRAVRQTLHWLVPEEAVQRPLETAGEARYLLCHAQRLHESFSRLPSPRGGNDQCLVIGSWGIEVPYLVGKLGWRHVTCVCAPDGMPGVVQRRRRDHPNGDESYAFRLIEHDIESGAWPFPPDRFGLAVFWGCLEHLRHDPEFALYELNRVCAPGAEMSLVSDNPISLQATACVIRGRPMPIRLHWPSADGHWRLYAPHELESLLSGTGWRVDLLTSIVPDPPVYWKWWKQMMFRHVVRDQRRGFGLADAFWNAFLLARAVKVASPTRSYPTWLYKDPKIRQLKIEMMEMVSREATAARAG